MKTSYLYSSAIALSILSLSLSSCGRQSLFVPIHGDESDPTPPSTSMGSSNQPDNTTTNATSNLSVGLHSLNGWKKNLPIKIKISEETLGESPNAVPIIRSAMDKWEAAAGVKLFEIVGTTPDSGTSFIDLFAPLRLDYNGIFSNSSWSTNTGKSSSVLATTVWENGTQDVTYIVKASILMNEESYSICDALVCKAEPNKIVVDLESLAIHELGHLLGLSHISPSLDRLSVMNPSMYIGPGETKRTISEGDKTRIKSIYNPTAD